MTSHQIMEREQLLFCQTMNLDEYLNIIECESRIDNDNLIEVENNLKNIRKKLSHTETTMAGVPDRFLYLRCYETEKHDAPVSVLIKIATLRNILLDRLLSTTLTLESLEMPNTETKQA